MSMYQQRFYRHYSPHAHALEIAYRESDLYIVSDSSLSSDHAKNILIKYYTSIEAYSKTHPYFLISLISLKMDEKAPPIIQDMLKVSAQASVGPFASVAGAVAHYVGYELLSWCNQIMIENGGDIFLKIDEDKKIGLYLGKKFNPEMITLKIKKRTHPFGICSSSATIGPSLNFGNADLVTIIANNTLVADAYATAYSNKIKEEKDVVAVMKEAEASPFIRGIIVAFAQKLYLKGDVEIDG